MERIKQFEGVEWAVILPIYYLGTILNQISEDRVSKKVRKVDPISQFVFNRIKDNEFDNRQLDVYA